MAPNSSLPVERISWHNLPGEIRSMILQALLDSDCAVANMATVSREWQPTFDKHIFSNLRIRSSRLSQFGPMTHRNRGLVKSLWLCIEVEEYNCRICAADSLNDQTASKQENMLVVSALQDFFSVLSKWQPNGDLNLDISVYSRSDSQHWFKYITFLPNTFTDPHEDSMFQHAERAILSQDNDSRHQWRVPGSSLTINNALCKVFDEIMSEGPFISDEEEVKWWNQLPAAPAVTSVMLRLQNHRRWKPVALTHLFSLFPQLQEIHYEPWREWDDEQQRRTDGHHRQLFESLASRALRKLVLFENFNAAHADYTIRGDGMRTPSAEIGEMIAKGSLNLEHLSVSFMTDAVQFLNFCDLNWEWPNLTSVVLTSQLLAPDVEASDIDDMLCKAVYAAKRMPKLETMEIWNGDNDLAALFRYEMPRDRQPARLIWRGTWLHVRRHTVVEAWEAVARQRGTDGSVSFSRELVSYANIASHGDAIRALGIAGPVLQPVSLRQILVEQRFWSRPL